MIAITRALARQFRAALRKAGAGRNQRPLLEFKTGLGVLRLRAQLPDVAIEYTQPGPVEEEALPLPIEALEDCEGKSNSTVTFVQTSQGVDATWEDSKIPRRKAYELSKAGALVAIPELDWSKATVVPGLLQALDAASQCVAKDSARYATNRIQLRGGRREIISSDSRQALIQGGFAFGFQADVLIPAVALFGCRELPDLPASICKGEDHVGIRVGDWSIYLLTDKHGRFPDVAKAIPAVTASATTLRLARQDADFLGQSLTKLPGSHDECAPVTVDLNGQVTLRARDEGHSPSTEVLLASSTAVGPAVCWHSDRRYLALAVSLGFGELSIIGPDRPVVCKDGTRTYCWVPLDNTQAIPASADVTRISTDEKADIPEPLKERMNLPMPTSNSNGRILTGGEGQPIANAHANRNGQANGATEHAENSTATAGTGLGALIAEAQALRDFLHDGYARAARLCVSLKRHRKQSKLVATTLASLRQLQQIEG